MKAIIVEEKYFDLLFDHTLKIIEDKFRKENVEYGAVHYLITILKEDLKNK